ncbi:MAG: DUF2062 domain-containing protein, partial [Betaproteobacteria bacterium]|nr:DUF2062 domain-containing protein [Betaproteobacteria bacterium]
VAIGLITGLIPGPLQILMAVIVAIPLRANVIAAAAATFYTNPFTFIPLYLLAYQVGAFVTGAGPANGGVVPPPFEWSLSRITEAIPAWFQWVLSLGDTLLIGLLIQASAFAVIGYLATMLVWRVVVTRMWRKRHAGHAKMCA